jgi:hypothetical protein
VDKHILGRKLDGCQRLRWTDANAKWETVSELGETLDNTTLLPVSRCSLQVLQFHCRNTLRDLSEGCDRICAGDLFRFVAFTRNYI